MKRSIIVRFVPRRKVAERITGNADGTRYDIVETIVKQFPEELAPWLPPKRKPWLPENPKQCVFNAVALALCALNR